MKFIVSLDGLQFECDTIMPHLSEIFLPVIDDIRNGRNLEFHRSDLQQTIDQLEKEITELQETGMKSIHLEILRNAVIDIHQSIDKRQ